MADDLRAPLRARINPALRHPDGLRGVFEATLTTDDARAVGLAYAALARADGANRIAVSRDGRASAPALQAAVIDGLCRGGMHVFRMPVGPTPVLAFTVDRLDLDGGVMVTGAHDPADRNGFKLFLGAAKLSGDALGALWEVTPTEPGGGAADDIDISGEYLAELAAEVETAHPRGIVWDSGNGATGEIVERLEHRLPGRHFTLHTEIDGRFPNHLPDPSAPQALGELVATVRRTGSDLGIALDGDGTVVRLLDSAGETVQPDQLLLLLARDALRERVGGTILVEDGSSAATFAGIAAAGGRAIAGPADRARLRERMLDTNAVLAGDMTGHIVFGDRWPCADDGLYVAARTIRALAREGVTLRQFRETLPSIA